MILEFFMKTEEIMMRRMLITVLLLQFPFLFFFVSCKTANKIFSATKSPHEQYSNHLNEAKLNTTALGMAWMNAAKKALQQPVVIVLPYKETGYFAAEQPNAAGYQFAAKRGEKIIVSVSVDTLLPLLFFADLFRADTTNPKFIRAADTANLAINYEVEEDGNYQLRLQPELLRSGQYTIVISTTGSLAFPVPAEDNPKIGSFWGANRDNGARKHEGIDIFGKFRTPVVAAANGYITSTKDNNLGGKVVFLRPDSKNFTLYYAHLDSQIAREGQEVKTGDVIGLMGNTGNAKTTPTHLHFGIYTNSGAIDPLPFVDKKNERPKEITVSLQSLNSYVHTRKSSVILASPFNKSYALEKVAEGTALQVTAATSAWYKVIVPNGKEGFIHKDDVSLQSAPIRMYTTVSNILLLDNATIAASPKKLISSGVPLTVW